MNENDIMVSICCLVYNHEKYLKKCLDGFVMQKTTFKFEVLIHDDASTDSSADIIREYEKKYPEIIKPIYQTENQYSKGVKISWTYQFPRASGKYIAFCEGDDYWTDEKKLQKQFEALEKNKQSVLCVHKVRDVDEGGNMTSNCHPNIDIYKKLTKDEMVILLMSDKGYQFQTSSYFFKACILNDYLNNIPEFVKYSKVGDWTYMMLAATKGDVIYINQEMSCYRCGSIGGWNDRLKSNDKYKEDIIISAIKSFHAYDEFTGNRYSNLIERKCLSEEYKLLQVKNDYKKMLQKKYKYPFSKQSKKEKLYVYIMAYCPSIMNTYQKIKRKIKNNE